ncbi:hypothetical protein PT974_08715 [Cladobotryum mycophilum]|uniref:Mid2 domain-containing protein n=1 Tax=Cladobotryum mycophilum TaxID=491253 RepID=A0ABR0SE40_9HYPO
MAGMSNLLRLLLLAVAMSSSTTSALPGRMFIQDTTCSASGLQACPAGLPNNFCCPQGSTCIALAANTTAVCCPQGMTCDKIQAITCNIRQQDPDQNANVPIKTSIFNVPLEKCGSDLCCPFGYSCAGGGQCQRNADQSKSPRDGSPASSSSTASVPTPTEPSTEPTSIAVTEPTTTAASTIPTTTEPAAASTTAATSESHASNPKTVSIVGGVIGACAVLVLIGVIAFLFVRRNRRQPPPVNEEKRSFSRMKNHGPGPFGNVISDPIIQGNSYRTDFILKQSPSLRNSLPLKSPSASSSISQKPPNITFTRSDDTAPRLTIFNPFNSPNTSPRSPTPSGGSVSPSDDQKARHGHVAVGARLQPIRAMKASSARVDVRNIAGMNREPSSENINVFADPYTMGNGGGGGGGGGGGMDRRLTHNTTFTDLMDEADLGDVRCGKPYVPGATPRI